MTIEGLMLLASLLALSSVLASKLSGRLGVPAMLLFLAIGIVAGSEGPGGIYFDNVGLAKAVGVVSLVLILYAGGLDTVWASIRPVLRAGLALATAGVVITAVLVGAFATLVSELSLVEAVLLGAIVASTDAAVVFSVLRVRSLPLREDVRTLLEFESGSNDPMAVFLTVGLITVITKGDSLAALVPEFFIQMGLGALLGYVLSRGMMFIINRIQLEQDGLYPVLSLALVVLTYGLTTLLHGSGFLAVYVAGVVMGNNVFIHKRSLTRFHDGLAWLAQIVMFLTLGLLVFPSQIVPVLGVGLLIAAFLILVARPFAVFGVLAFSHFSWGGRAMIAMGGLRGAVPIILATFPLVAGVPEADTIFNVVFLIVISSALVQGVGMPWMARLFRVEGPPYLRPSIVADEAAKGYIAEYRVPAGSPLVGRQLAKAGLPPKAQAFSSAATTATSPRPAA
jgi:cell volume regulation protein A